MKIQQSLNEIVKIAEVVDYHEQEERLEFMSERKQARAIPSKETLTEQLSDRGMEQKKFALRMNLSEKNLSRLLKGKALLTKELPRNLESVLGLAARF